MRGRLALLMITGALLAGCSSQGTVTTSGAEAGSGASTASSTGPSSGPSSSAPSSSASGSVPVKDATILLGVGKTKVTIYEDYRCPPCKIVHDQLQPILAAQLGAGKIQLEFHAIDLIDRNTGGKGSVAAGNAASCAFQAGKFQPYNDALFAAQPQETDDAFAGPAKLISIAQTVPGLDSPAFEQCVTTQPFAASIDKTYDAEVGSNKLAGVPAVFIDGTQWTVPGTPAGLAASFTHALSTAEG